MSCEVKVVSHSVFVENELYSLEDIVAYVARVSNPANQDQKDNKKLISYLINNKHWSPFEMVNLCLEIKTTRDIGRQILRHRSYSFQEFSQRYAVVEDSSFTIREARNQDNKNRQNSIDNTPDNIKKTWEGLQLDLIDNIKADYRWAIDNGIAKECARAILPEGLTKTTMYMSGTLRSWIHYIKLREANGTQKEHMDIALECKEAISKYFPLINEI